MTSNRLAPIALATLFPLLSGCIAHSSAENSNTLINFSEIAAGENTINGEQENRKIEVFTDQTSLNSALAVYLNSAQEHTVDFALKRAVLLSMGGQNSGGYSIATEAIEERGNYIILKVVLTQPGDGCMTTQALTSPYQFVEIDSVKELIINERVVVMDCSQ